MELNQFFKTKSPNKTHKSKSKTNLFKPSLKRKTLSLTRTLRNHPFFLQKKKKKNKETNLKIFKNQFYKIKKKKKKRKSTSHVPPRSQGVHCRVPLRHCKLAYTDLINNTLLSVCRKRGVARARLSLKRPHTISRPHCKHANALLLHVQTWAGCLPPLSVVISAAVIRHHRGGVLRVAVPRRPESWLIASNHLQERSPASACTRRLVTLAAVDACVRAFVDVCCRWERESTRGRAERGFATAWEEARLPQSFLRLFFFYSDSLSVSFQRKMKGVVHTGWFFWNFFWIYCFENLKCYYGRFVRIMFDIVFLILILVFFERIFRILGWSNG